MNKLILLCLFALVACTTDDTSNPAPVSETEKGVLWVCYTHSSCGGEGRFDQGHEVCARPTQFDIQSPGDRMALDWRLLWEASCHQNEGIMNVANGRAPGQSCVNKEGDPLNYYCRAECFPQFIDC